MGRINVRLEDDIHRRAKSISALRGETLVTYVNVAIEFKVKKVG